MGGDRALVGDVPQVLRGVALGQGVVTKALVHLVIADRVANALVVCLTRVLIRVEEVTLVDDRGSVVDVEPVADAGVPFAYGGFVVRELDFVAERQGLDRPGMLR